MSGKKPKLGSGQRFANLKSKLIAQGNSPQAAQKEAAAIGIRKYGNKKMASMATKGRKKK